MLVISWLFHDHFIGGVSGGDGEVPKNVSQVVLSTYEGGLMGS